MGNHWRGCPFVRFADLTPEQKIIARRRFSARGRRSGWEQIEWWGFAVRKDGKLANCPYIHPYGSGSTK